MNTLPAEVLAELPERAASEQEWQNALLLCLPHWCPVHVHRQNAGNVPAKRGGVIKGAPPGASDITGWTIPDGITLQIECKMPGEKLNPAQRRWRAMVKRTGPVYQLAMYDAGVGLLDNLETFATGLNLAVKKRRVR